MLKKFINEKKRNSQADFDDYHNFKVRICTVFKIFLKYSANSNFEVDIGSNGITGTVTT